MFAVTTRDQELLAAALDRLTTEANRVAFQRPGLSSYEDQVGLAGRLQPLASALLHFRQLSEGPPILYDAADSEILRHTTLDQAVQAALDGFETPEDFPDTLTVTVYRRLMPTASHLKHPSLHSPLTDLLERLDEDHLGEDQEYTQATPAMQAAESAFLTAVLLQYRSFWCESSGTARVDVAHWLRQNRPDIRPIRSRRTQICGHCYRPRGDREMRTCSACRRRGCSRCWRRAEASDSPWPRPHLGPHSCSFRLQDHLEEEKTRRRYDRLTAQRGWGSHDAGPVSAE